MNRKPPNELDWRTLLWEDTPTTGLGSAAENESLGGHVVTDEDNHHCRRRRERRIDPLHRPMPVRA